MKIENFDTQEIQITGYNFKNAGQGFDSYPSRMLLDGCEYSFVGAGMRFVIRRGQQLIRLFDVNDGRNQYRLRAEGNRWTLVNTKAMA